MGRVPRTVAVGVFSVLAALTLVGVFALGSCTARPDVPAEDSVDVGFLRDMTVHHAQAVTLAYLAQQRVHSRPVRDLADDVLLTQQREIGIMTGWLELWGRAPSSPDRPMAWMSHRTAVSAAGPGGTATGALMPGMATDEEVARFAVLRGPGVDAEFCRLMLAHHVGGLHMIDEAIGRAKRPEVVALARRMRTDQQREVTVLMGLIPSFR